MTRGASPAVRVSLRLSGQDAAELPLTVGVIGDFSAGTSPMRLEERLFEPVGDRNTPAVMAGIRPRIEIAQTGDEHPLPLALPLATDDGLRLVFDHPADFDPARLCVSPTAPPLAAVTSLRQGLLAWLRRDEPAPLPDWRVLQSRTRAVAATLPVALPNRDGADPDAVGFAGVLAWSGLLSDALRVTAEAAWLGGPPGDGDPAGGVGRHLKPAEVQGFSSAFIAHAIEAVGTAGPWPADWDRRVGADDVLLGTLRRVATGGLAEALTGVTPLEPDHAAWLAAALEVRGAALLHMILRNRIFCDLEASWRSVMHLLAGNSRRDVEILLLDVDKPGLYDDLRAGSEGDLRHTRLFNLTYFDRVARFNERPFSVLLCLFDICPADAADARALKVLASIGAACHCPVILSLDPGTVSAVVMRSADDKAPAPRPVHPTLRSLRETPEARMVALAGPRFVARPVHARRPNRATPLPFREIPPSRHEPRPWLGGGVALVERIIAAHRTYGWPVAIGGIASGNGVIRAPGGDRVPGDDATHGRIPDGEILVTAQAQSAFVGLGYAAACQVALRRVDAFVTTPTLFEPRDRDPARFEALIQSRLPYALATARIIQLVKVEFRNLLGSNRSRSDIEMRINEILAQWVAWQPDASEEVRAQRPLRRAKVQLEGGTGGTYRATIRLQPHFQLEHIDADLVLIAELPTAV